MQVGDNVAIGTEWGRIRSMRDPAGRQLKEALPGQPVEIMGLRSVPQAGDDLIVVPRCALRNAVYPILSSLAHPTEQRTPMY